jgi:hypothetical protein
MLIPIIPWDAVQGIAAALTVIGGAGSVTITQVLPWARTRRAKRAIQQHVRDQDFLPSVIEGSLRHFVEPTCTNTDPAGREDYRALAPLSLPLFQVLDRLLYQSIQPQYIILLADSGIGKTTALLNYFVRNLRRRNAYPIHLVYLGTEGAEERIAEAREKENTILFLDALDEDKNAVTDHAARVRVLLQAAKSFRSVVMSCRSQFFPSDEEITRETGLVRVGPIPAGDTGEYVFQKLYIEPFSDAQIQQYLRRRYPLSKWSARRQAKRVLATIGDLSARPMLLAYVDDLLQSGRRIQSVSEAYRQIVEAWFAREKRYVGDIEALRKFSEALSVEVFVGSRYRKGEFVSADEISDLAKQWNIPLETWKLTGRSLLNRNATGEYKFAHRSIMEYLFATMAARNDVRAWEVVWTDQISRFMEDVPSDQEFVLRWMDIGVTEPEPVIINAASLASRWLSHPDAISLSDQILRAKRVLPLVRLLIKVTGVEQPVALVLVSSSERGPIGGTFEASDLILPVTVREAKESILQGVRNLGYVLPAFDLNKDDYPFPASLMPRHVEPQFSDTNDSLRRSSLHKVGLFAIGASTLDVQYGIIEPLAEFVLGKRDGNELVVVLQELREIYKLPITK